MEFFFTDFGHREMIRLRVVLGNFPFVFFINIFAST